MNLLWFLAIAGVSLLAASSDTPTLLRKSNGLIFLSSMYLTDVWLVDLFMSSFVLRMFSLFAFLAMLIAEMSQQL